MYFAHLRLEGVPEQTEKTALAFLLGRLQNALTDYTDATPEQCSVAIHRDLVVSEHADLFSPLIVTLNVLPWPDRSLSTFLGRIAAIIHEMFPDRTINFFVLPVLGTHIYQFNGTVLSQAVKT